jgi:hypothetical protein
MILYTVTPLLVFNKQQTNTHNNQITEIQKK